MNPRHFLQPLFSTVFLALFLAGCATLPPPSLQRDTTDLGEVVDDALALADRHGREHVLVVFDLDNTLLAMEQGLGADQWYDWQKALSDQDPCGPMTVPDRFAVQGAMYYASAMRLTQENAPALVRRLQDGNLRVIALTSRGTVYRLQTFRELRRHGFDFRRSALSPAEGWPEDFVPERGERPSRYEDGVYLTSGQHKGDMLLELLERTNTPLPSVIVMADDKQKNLDAVVETMTGNGAAVRAWRYAGEDGNVAAFDPGDAHRLWTALEPALRTLQSLLGADNYELPPANETCTP